jgi:formyl-CoA transferase
MQPMAGMRVLDFGRYIAGPWCAQLLQGYGAEVIRFERPGGAEDRGLFELGDEVDGAIVVHMNRGKRSFTLSPTTDPGRAVVARLVATADVVVANLPDAALERMGLDWPTLRAAHPRLILATATMFGTTGPAAGRLGFDGVGQAMSGAIATAGRPGDPMKSFVPWVDFQTGTALAGGVLAALLDRATSGTGHRVEVDLLGSAVSAAGAILLEEAATSIGRGPTGNRHTAIGPSDVVPTADGAIITQVIGDAMFARWCDLVDRIDLVDDRRFATDADRGANSEVLSEVLATWCRSRTTDEVLEAMAAAKVPAGPVLTPAAALDDPQIAALLEPVDVPGRSAPLPGPGHPVTIDGDRLRLGAALTPLGADTDDVLISAGYELADIAELRASGTI